jgi:hypothetical protein
VAGDLGVRKAVGLVYRDGALPSEQETRALTAHWGAAASLAQELALYALAHSMAAPATLPSATPPLATPGATARRRARPPDASRAPRAPA